ncbi:phosphate uptake regulator PhoU [bacterium]|nr:phosphate uptake regulator PhoU [bacterium]
MFRTLLHALRAASSLKDVKENFCSMLSDTEDMFRAVTDVLLGKTDPDKIKDGIYTKDREVNRKEQDIRRRLVGHLSLRRMVDAPTCLVFMSVAKDVERIGDYCKNILEVAAFYSIPGSQARYAVPLREISEQIGELIEKTRKAFTDSDESLAKEVLRSHEVVAKKCDMLIGQVLNDTLQTKEAVSTALLSRYFKRVVRHLGNIVSSVVAAVEKIDFPPK